MSDYSKTSVITARVNEQLDRTIEELRKAENRSKSNMIETLLKEALQARATNLTATT